MARAWCPAVVARLARTLGLIGEHMRVVEPVEVLYLTLMQRWERSAPDDRHQGELDGEVKKNTQTERLKYVLEKIAIGSSANTERVYSTLARYSRRQDGESYISRRSAWMQQPESLSGGWYFEGCTSLLQKQDVVSALSHVGISGPFVQAVADFVAHKPIERYFPTDEDENEINRRILAWEARNEA
jgi:hypothetical protein